MTTTKKRLIQVAIALAIVSLSVFAVLGVFAESKPDRFKRINVGDSKASVTSSMGEPDEIRWCTPDGSAPNETKSDYKPDQCFQEYVYGGFLEQLVVAFDGHDQVVEKNEIVSP